MRPAAVALRPCPPLGHGRPQLGGGPARGPDGRPRGRPAAAVTLVLGSTAVGLAGSRRAAARGRRCAGPTSVSETPMWQPLNGPKRPVRGGSRPRPRRKLPGKAGRLRPQGTEADRIQLPCFSMRDPYASLMLHGVKTLETRSHAMLVGVEGICLLHIGFQTMAEDVAGLYLWQLGYGRKEIEMLMKPPRNLDRGQVLGVVELGKTRKINEVEQGMEDTQRKVCAEAVGQFATQVLRAWWLKKPIKQKGNQGVWRMMVWRNQLPGEVLERLEGGPASESSSETSAEADYVKTLPSLPPLQGVPPGGPVQASAAEASSATPGDLEDPGSLPSMVVFDLDGVCWSPEMYQTRGGPPYRLQDGGASVLNSAGEEIRLYEAVQRVWSMLGNLRNVRVAVASSSRRDKAVPLLRKLTVAKGVRMADVLDDSLFEMYYVRGMGKRPHLEEILRKSGVPPDEVLFVDDSAENIASVQELGVVAVHMPRGMTEEAWAGALTTYQLEHGEG
uniref:Magnesium-dependent phosphatase 1 n=1 Tax=Alexandrium monilatum TaxID=311494 RepID=A0A7S4WBS2_9DINO